MAAADITKAQLATFFGTDLTAVTLRDPVTRNATASPAVTVDIRGKWAALLGDNGGTPYLVGVGDTLEQLRSYVGASPHDDVSVGTSALVFVKIPSGMT